MVLSRKTEYAISALTFLAKNNKKGLFIIKDIAKAKKIPASFLAKIFQELVKNNIIVSFKGKSKGCKLARSPAKITLFEIIKILEGDQFYNQCFVRSSLCTGDTHCALHSEWKKIRIQIEKMLKRITLDKL